jgi:hypothetical protein
MPTTTPNPPPLPHIEIPIVDPTTGRLTIEWYRWFAFYDRIWRQLRKEIP